MGLFCNREFCEFSQSKLEFIYNEISQIKDDDLLLPDRTEMIEALVKQNELEPIKLEEDENKFSKEWSEGVYEMLNASFTRVVNVQGVTITWNVPIISGDEYMLQIRPSTFACIEYNAYIIKNSLHLSKVISLADLDKEPDKIEFYFRNQLDMIQEAIKNLNNDIYKFNDQLKPFIVGIIDKREKKANIIKKALETMKIPLKKNDDAPSIIPITRKLVRPELPSVKKEKTASISNEDYDHIIGVIRHVGATFERTRKTFFKLSEEELRDIILSNLNGHYKGLANGETFRSNGKTDISIEFENRSAFVGECKLWKGREVFEETINQLISYTTWRDSKNAIIIFNKNNKDFVGVQRQIPDLIKGTLGFQRMITSKQGEWGFVLKIPDKCDEKIIHVFLFDIFCENKKNT